LPFPHYLRRPFLSLPQPYKTQQRLAVEFATLCVALAFNAACFGPATELFSGDFSVSFGASVCMIVINQIFSQLYVLSAQWAAEKHSTWSTWTVLMHALVASVAVGSIFLCLVYSVQFDAGVTARWFAVVLMSFAQSSLFTGPLWILFKLFVYVLLARFHMRGMTPNEQRRALAVGDKGVIMVDEEAADATNAFAGPKHLPAVIEMSAVVVGAAEAPESHHHVNSHLPASVASTQKLKKIHGGFVAFDDDDDSSHGNGAQQHASHQPESIVSVAVTAFANPLFSIDKNHHQQFDDEVSAGDDNNCHDLPVESQDIASKRKSHHQHFDLISIPTDSHDSDEFSGTRVQPSRSIVVLHPNAFFDPAFAQAAGARVVAVASDAAEEEADAAATNGLESGSGIDALADAVSSDASVSTIHSTHPSAHARHQSLPIMLENVLFDSAAASDLFDDYAVAGAQNSSALHMNLSPNILYDPVSAERTSESVPVSDDSSSSPA
jgi:hypothetical protein